MWWIAPTYQVSKLGWREVTGAVSQFPVPTNVKETTMTVEFPYSGGSISFKSADSPDNLRGEGLDYIIMDEADFVKADVWEQILRPALADRKGGAIFISTPKVENGWFHKLFKRGQTGEDPEIKSWSFSSYTNPYIDPKEIDSARENMPSIVFRQEFLAEFIGAQGARVKAEWLQFEDTPFDRPGWKVALGVDLAISQKTTADYTALVVLGRDPHGILHIMDARRDRLSFASQIDFIKAMAEKWQPDVIAIEDVMYQRAMVQTISAATSFAVRGVKVTTDKIARFSPVEARYENKQVYHSRNLPNYFELELLSFPAGEHDDLVDALSHAFKALRDPQAMQTRPIAPVVFDKTDGFKNIGAKGENGFDTIQWGIR